ncbi:MAG: TatD family deoxyribonuclease [Gammaproteobacteria bacterium]|nr:MAG: TatD family deoxyribonuclease [Gammaproteobacteria bacterium]
MFFDSHCHLDRIDLSDYDDDFDRLLATIKSDGVTRMVCIGVTLESFDDMYRRIENCDQVYCTAGVHPDYEDTAEPSVEQLCELAERERVVAIGETGLDYFHQPQSPEWQRRRFVTHIEAARKCDLPLVVHTRDAREDTLELLRRHDAKKVGGVLHCFTEDWEMARAAIELDFYISISGIVTFQQAQNVRDMAQQIPLERLLIETDAPWLSPAPFRGKPNHPGRVRLVAEKLAEIRGQSVETIAVATFENANRLFRLNHS